MELHEKKFKLQASLQETEEGAQLPSTTPLHQATAKLPKIDIGRFEGSFMDWPRYWGQFTETIDKADIAPISKFTYLCGLLGVKVKCTVEALPFNSEGYNQAKALLQDRYGKDSEIIKAYVKEIMDLPHIQGANTKKISEFSEKLFYCVQALETMKKLSKVNGNVPMTLDKLSGIRGDLVRTDPNWEQWDFVQLAQAVKQWIRRNPIDAKTQERETTEQQIRKRERSKLFQARNYDYKIQECVYCEDSSHKPSECQKVTSIDERKRILAQKRICFNCATPNHHASECFSKATCQTCRKRHHTSICKGLKLSTQSTHFDNHFDRCKTFLCLKGRVIVQYNRCNQERCKRVDTDRDRENCKTNREI